MKDDFTRHHLLAKLNTRAFSMLSAIMLICSGTYMCFLDLSAKGVIDIKATFIEGKIETGSLGLMAMFLGAIIVLALNLNKPYKGQEIKIVVDGNEITGTGLSYRKMRELIATISARKEEGSIKKTPSKRIKQTPRRTRRSSSAGRYAAQPKPRVPS